MTSDLTLPGDIPGLLRRGSPVTRGDLYGVVRDAYDEIDRIRVVFDAFSPGRRPQDHPATVGWTWAGTEVGSRRNWHLDLTDPTGRAHAAWWADPRYSEGAPEQDDAVQRAMGGEDMTPEQVVILRDLVLRLAGRTAP